jgi:regulator of replication initiation timing
MTENLLQKLEEKVMMLLTEIEESRREIQRLSHENSLLKIERENHAKKLTDLISLLDTVNAADSLLANVSAPAMKPVLVQG